MLSFVKSIATAQGDLSFYFNELSSTCFLISVVDRKNKTHLLYVDKNLSAWQARENPASLPFWNNRLEAALCSAVSEQKEERPLTAQGHLAA